MEGQKKSIYASTPFKFIIDGNPLYIHADLVSPHSKPLDRLMNGHMAEAQTGSAVLQDVDEGTFARFVHWAYNGYYSEPDFNIAEDNLSVEEPVKAKDTPTVSTTSFFGEVSKPEPAFDFDTVDDDWGGNRCKRCKKALSSSWQPERPPPPVRSSGSSLKESFIKRQPIIRQESSNIPPSRPNQSPREDYTDIFLSHAQLYVFADKYDIQSLKMLALDNLHATLAVFTLYKGRTRDIIELLRYAYANTGESMSGEEDLRTLMTHYVSFEMNTLIKDEGFKELMINDGGALLGDFLSVVGKRI